VAGGIYYFLKESSKNGLPAPNNSYGQKRPAATNLPDITPTPTEQMASTTEPTAQAAEIVIRSFSFQPAELQIKVGTQVKWTNQDSANHTIASDNFQSEQLSKGQNYSRIFNEVGSFDYYCLIHPSMRGKIVVSP
jgi:plastocyanin